MPVTLIAGGIITAVIVVLSLLAPILPLQPFDQMDIMRRFEAPGALHWLGTDEFGRDVLSRMMYGGRLSLTLGLGATLISVVIGLPLGLIAGYHRGRFDELIMRGVDILISVPPIMMGMLILALTSPNLIKTSAVVGLIYVPIIVRISRGVTLGIVQEDFIQAARARGERLPYMLFAEIMPNILPPVIVEAGLRVSFAMLLGAALSFLGLGVQPPSSDWGLMIAEARPFVDSAPWIALAPGVALVVTVIGINLLGDGLREKLDPRMARGIR